MKIVFLKLGGSLITDKEKPYTAKLDLLAELARQIKESYQDGNQYQLIIGHGSGSFGHQAAKKYGTRNGVNSREDWFGFLEVWKQARGLNQIVIEALTAAGLPVLAFPPVSAVIAENQKIKLWDTQLIQTALTNKLIPVIYGDVIFDKTMHGTILSTEELFQGLAKTITPDYIFIAGIEKGVWHDFPACSRLMKELTPSILASQESTIAGSNAVDVTGGMAEKVNQMMNLVQYHPNLKIQIFSAEQPENIRRVLDGEQLGTLIHIG
ncbi:MAG: isopentenyl phosphate kinase family protein [Anaerolineaceae bacterium]|nr:isopentenyl phosphate kinase family protein [Anaerolineaceae bacterium]